MSKNSVFNVAVCVLGIFILLIHIINLLIKKNKRKDEKALLDFFVFTAVHFAAYTVFSFVKMVYTSNAYIIAFYTAFYLLNNVEVFMLYKYMKSYTELSGKSEKIVSAINVSLFCVFMTLDLINVFTGIFFTAENGVYLRSKTMIFSQGYQFVMLILVVIVTSSNKNLNVREKTSFALYCFLPFVAIIFQNVFKGYAIAYTSIIIATEVLFFFLNVQKNIDLAKEEQKNKEAQIKIMLSQIKPHFVYNALSSISTLITIEPEKAQSALDDFTEYLRHNLSSLTETKLIPFEKELRHIETYVSLEKLRFGDRINVVYEIKSTDFYVPTLSIQPIVENAIKHGILKKLEGGTVTLKTFETDKEYVVEIKDDGVGFNPEDLETDENEHIGLRNIQFRIKNYGGNMIIKSEKDKRTVVTVTLLK